jgi:hypothetical protein
MNRNLASALVIASTAAAAVALAALSPANAYADDITIESTPFKGSRSRAEVLAELQGQAAVVRTGATEWSLQSNRPLKRQSVQTSEQARTEYKASRDYVRALNAEDSGSAYFIKSTPRDRSNPGATMGGPAR